MVKLIKHGGLTLQSHKSLKDLDFPCHSIDATIGLKDELNSKYIKPDAGIPKADLDFSLYDKKEIDDLLKVINDKVTAIGNIGEADITKIKSDVTSLSSKMTSAEADIANAESNISIINTDIAQIKSSMASGSAFKDLEDKINSSIDNMQEEVDATLTYAQGIRTDVDIINEKIRNGEIGSGGSGSGDGTISGGGEDKKETVSVIDGQQIVIVPFEYPIGNKMHVYKNGVLQDINADYTETSVNSITFAQPLSVYDKITFIIDLGSSVILNPRKKDVSYSYDTNGVLIRETHTGEEEKAIDYEYNESGNIKKISMTRNNITRVATYEYDEFGNVSVEHDEGVSEVFVTFCDLRKEVQRDITNTVATLIINKNKDGIIIDKTTNNLSLSEIFDATKEIDFTNSLFHNMIVDIENLDEVDNQYKFLNSNRELYSGTIGAKRFINFESQRQDLIIMTTGNIKLNIQIKMFKL